MVVKVCQEDTRAVYNLIYDIVNVLRISIIVCQKVGWSGGLGVLPPKITEVYDN